MSLLDGHPEVLVDINDSRFFGSFLRKAVSLDLHGRSELAQSTIVHEWDEDNVYYDLFLSHISPEEVLERYQKALKPQPSYADYLTEAVLAYGMASKQVHEGTRWWVEKTPGNEFFARLIFDWWSKSRFIHMIRDPRDVYTSAKRRAVRSNRKMPSPENIAARWRASIRELDVNQDTFGTERYVAVRYEDLVQNPEQELTRLRSFLSIEDADILYQPTKGGGVVDWKGNAVKKKFGAISTKGVGRWKDHLSSREVRRVEAFLHPEMQRHGYTPEYPNLVGDRIRSFPRFALNQARILRRGMRYKLLIRRAME
jgi:hypothetical protein